MSDPKRNLNKEIIALFSGQASIVTTPKLYIQLTGNYNQANVLNQCFYWSSRSSCEDGWFYKEYKEWFKEIHIPERTLRRIFDKLEQKGWITTKIKKVNGINIKHILPHMDKVIDSISNNLHKNRPDRPLCPDGIETIPKNCTNIAPTGHIGRLEPATLSDHTIYTDEYLQITKNCNTTVDKFLFSSELEKKILEQKLPSDKRSDLEFLNNCKSHIDFHSDKRFSHSQRIHGLISLLKKLNKSGVIFSVTQIKVDKTLERREKELLFQQKEREELRRCKSRKLSDNAEEILKRLHKMVA